MNRTHVLTAAVLAACGSLVFPPEATAQNSAQPVTQKQGTLDKIKVHGKALKGTLKATRRTATFSFTFRPATLPIRIAAIRWCTFSMGTGRMPRLIGTRFLWLPPLTRPGRK